MSASDAVDSLYDAWRDGRLSAREHAELEALVAGDDIARERFIAAARVDRLLRATARTAALDDLQRRVLASASVSGRHRTIAAVIASVEALPTPAQRRWRWQLSAVALAAAALLVVALSGGRTLAPAPTIELSPAAAAVLPLPSGAVAEILAQRGVVRVGATTGRLQPLASRNIPLPSEIVLAEDARLALRLPDGGTLQLDGRTHCAISAQASNIVLHQGQLDGDFHQTRWVLTPQVLAETAGTALSVTVAGDHSRLQGHRGALRVQHLLDDSESEVVPGGELLVSGTVIGTKAVGPIMVEAGTAGEVLP